MNAFKSRVPVALKLSVLATVLYACTEIPSIDDIVVRPTSLAAVGSTTFNAVAGSTTTNPAQVRVLDQTQQAMANQAVTFAASRGTLSAPTANTNQAGQATPSSWTAPTSTGPATITATIPNYPSIAAVPFNITVTAAPATTQTKTASTDNQSTIAGSSLTTNAPEVTVVDQFGNAIPGVVVTFTILTGGGTLNGASLTTANVTTDANGKAKLTSWVLGATIGSNTVRATTTVLASQPLTFTATGTVGPPNKIVIAPPGNSQAQTATAGSNVAVNPAVLVTDVNNNPLNNVGVRFAINVGGGKVISSTGTQVTQVDVTTNAQGIASSFGWMVFDLGANSLTVTVTTATGVTPFAITATSVAGPPTQIAVFTETPSSNNQTAIANSNVAIAPAAIVKDANGFVVSGVSVTFTVGASSGTVKLTSTGSQVTAGAINTDAQGVARVFTWTLGPNKGANTVTAALTSNASINTTFTATGTAGPPASIAIVTESPSSNNQTTVANTATPVAPGVVVKDANNLTVDAGVNIGFTITNGGGVVSATGCTGSATAVVVPTDVNGVARVGCWKPGTVGTGNTLRAAVVATPTIFVTFLATGTVGPATSITFTNQPWGFTRATFNNGGEPMVKVADAGGNGISGLTVTWSNAGNTNSSVGGTLTSLTNASGIASFLRTQGGTWTAANVASGASMTLQASITSPALSASASSIVVTAPVTVSNVTSPSGTTPVNTVATATPVLIVRDASSRPVPSTALTWSITANPGGSSTATLTASQPATDSVGQAGAGSWKVASTAGTNTINALVTGTGLNISFNTTGVAGAATQIAVNAGNSQTASTGAAVTTPPAVLVRDQFNNAVSGVGVTFSPTTSSGSVTGSPANTNASGIATVGSWTLGSTAGAQTLNAFITASPAITTAFTATATNPCLSPASHTIGQATVNGTLNSGDCNYSESGTFYMDLFRISVSSGTSFFSSTVTTSVITPSIRSFLYNGNEHWISNGTGPGTITRYYVVGPGNHDLGVTSTTLTTSGTYAFSTAANPALPASQCFLFATKGIVIQQTLSTSCLYTYVGGSGEVASRGYQIFLPANQAMTVRLDAVSSGDLYLEAYVSGTTTLVASDDDGGAGTNSLMVVASSASPRYLLIRAAHHTLSAQGNYNFTLTIDP